MNNKYFCEYHLTSQAQRDNKQDEKCYEEGVKRVLNTRDMIPRLLCEEHFHYVNSEAMKRGNFMATKKKDGTGFKTMRDQSK
jgi:hypothetical protein